MTANEWVIMRSPTGPRGWVPAASSAIHSVAYRPPGADEHPSAATLHPAQPLCLLLFQRGGPLNWQPLGENQKTRQPPLTVPASLSFRGPMTGPWAVFPAPGTEQLWIWFYPEAVAPVLGLEPHPFRNRWEPWSPPTMAASQTRACQEILKSPWPLRDSSALSRLVDEEQLELIADRPPPAGSVWRAAFEHSLRQTLSGGGVRTQQRLRRRLCGLTASELQRWERVDQVLRRLLSESRHRNRHLGQIARELGFCDQSHLNRALRQMTGLSPRELTRSLERPEMFWPYLLHYCGSLPKTPSAAAR